MSYRMRIDPGAAAAGRFISHVHRELQRAFSTAAEKGLTQQQLAELLDVDRSTVNKRLLGQTNLTLRTIVTMARAMGYRPSFSLEPLALAVEAGMNERPAGQGPEMAGTWTTLSSFTTSSPTGSRSSATLELTH